MKYRASLTPRRAAESCQRLQDKTLLTEKTSFTEGGLTASVRREPGEKVRFHRTDDVPFREAFGLTHRPACDLIVHLAKGERDVVAFVELKGVDAGDGREQIESTLRAAKTCIEAEAARRERKMLEFRGLVIARGPAPTRPSKLLPVQHKTLPKKSKTYDFGAHLR